MKKFRVILFILLLVMLATLAFACKSVSPVKISVLTEPTSTDVTQGGTLDVTGGEILITYEDGTTKAVSMSDVEVRDVNYDSIGEHTAVLVYTEEGKSYSTTLKVTVLAPSVRRITLDYSKVERQYYEGASFDPEGLEVTAYYENGKSAVISAYSVTPSRMTVGLDKVRVTYRGASAEIPVTVIPKAVTEITVTKPFDKTEYYVGDEFEPAGIEVQATYNSGDSFIVDDDEIDFVRRDGTAYIYPTSENDDIVIVSYRAVAGARIAVKLTVLPLEPESLAIAEMEEAEVYYDGDVFSFSKTLLTVHVVYNNGAEGDLIAYSGNFDAPATPLSAGDESVEIWMKGYPNVKLTVPVTVGTNNIESVVIYDGPDIKEFAKGSLVDLTGLSLRVTYESGRTEIVTYGDEGVTMTATPSTVSMDTSYVTVTYEGFTDIFFVSVYDNTRYFESLYIENEESVKTVYAIGETADLTGAEFRMAFNIGESAVFTAEDVVVSVQVFSGGALKDTSVIDATTTSLYVSVTYTAADGTFEGSTFLPVTVE